jgi:O-antigen ligase
MRQSFQRTPGFILPLLGYDPREYAQFISRNHFSFLMEMVFGLIAGLIVGRGVRRERLLLYVAALLIVWIALILANSRGGILSMLSQLIFTALMLTSFQPPRAAPDEMDAARGGNRAWHLAGSLAGRVLLIASLLGAAVAGVVWVGGDPVVSRLETVSSEVSAEERGGLWKQGATRIQIWDATWELIKDHPFAGVGFGGYWTAITQYHRATGEVTPQEAHNDYLELAASGGIIGVALAVWFVVVFVRRVRQTLRASDPFRRAACLGALIGLFGVAVHSLVDFGLHITINALMFTALIAVAASNPAHETPLASEANSLS